MIYERNPRNPAEYDLSVAGLGYVDPEAWTVGLADLGVNLTETASTGVDLYTKVLAAKAAAKAAGRPAPAPAPTTVRVTVPRSSAPNRTRTIILAGAAVGLTALLVTLVARRRRR